MATEVTTRLIDDLAKKQGLRVVAENTVVFGYAGQDYTIDLSAQNTTAFWAAIKPFVEAATLVPASKGGSKKKAAAPKETAPAAPKVTAKPKSGANADKGGSSDAIRVWARNNGYEIGDRGRIPNEIREAWEAAGSPGAVAQSAPEVAPTQPVTATEPLEENTAESTESSDQPADEGPTETADFTVADPNFVTT